MRLPVDAHTSLVVLAAGLQAVQTMIGSIEKRIMAQHRSNEASQLLETIPGIDRAGLVVDCLSSGQLCTEAELWIARG
jgi:hypothetical protein